MKTTLTTLLLLALLLVVCVDDSFLLTLPETQIIHQSNSPNRVKLPETYMEISFKVEDSEAYDEQYSEAYWQQVRLTSRNLRKG